MKKTTDELKKTLCSKKDIDAFISENENELVTSSFVEQMEFWIKEKNITKADLIKKTNLYTTYGYEILRGDKLPSRDKAIQLCLALKLSIKETDHVLYSINCEALYPRSKRDSIIMFALENHMSVLECDEQLFDHQLEALS